MHEFAHRRRERRLSLQAHRKALRLFEYVLTLRSDKLITLYFAGQGAPVNCQLFRGF